MYRFYEFFAGAGMVRAGLGRDWKCVFANDSDPKKVCAYKRNWGASEVVCADIAKLSASDLPGTADLAWASFPCQDLSLAGKGAGLQGKRSGTFWSFWRLMEDLCSEGRAPSMVVLENVQGAVTSNKGRDFSAIASAIGNAGYLIGALIVDAAKFVPQSRPRLFVIAVRERLGGSGHPWDSLPAGSWHPAPLTRSVRRLPAPIRSRWVWWRLPEPPPRESDLADLIESDPSSVHWHSQEQTNRLLGLMNPLHRKKVEFAQMAGHAVVGTVYKRMRHDRSGIRRQCAEIRFDGIAGCLRTPQGGSSRQTVMIVNGSKIRSRLLSPREAARLMGLPDSYKLPRNYNEAYRLSGDGVVVPVVSFLAKHVLEPIIGQCDLPAIDPVLDLFWRP